MPADRPYIFLICDSKHTYIFFGLTQTKVNNLSIAIVHFSLYLFSIDILKFSKRCVLNTYIQFIFYNILQNIFQISVWETIFFKHSPKWQVD